MKFRTTTKAIREGQSKKFLISVDYCGLQHLLYFDSPVAYTCGVYGWNYDVYNVDDYVICIGYRGMPTGLKIDYKIIRKYDDMAKHVLNNISDYDKKREMLNNLKQDLIKEIRQLNGLNY